MLAGPVTGVDHRNARYFRRPGRAAGLVMAHDDHVGVAVHDARGIGQALPLGGAGEFAGIFGGDHRPAQTQHGALEGKARSRGGLIEQRGHDAAVQGLGEAVFTGQIGLHLVGGTKHRLQQRAVKLLGFDDMIQRKGRHDRLLLGVGMGKGIGF
ncbi:hypothetical protein DESC_150042 [Desulfosarcina cetonica]|nr:hypothetical protein DESC_150042 [Desulfosarcina cetonica]